MTTTAGEPLYSEPIHVAPRPAIRDWSQRQGFTPELVARWVEFFPQGAKQMLASLIAPVPTYLRVNTLRTDAATLAGSLAARGFTTTQVEAPDDRLAVLRLDASPFAVSATPEYLAGEAYLQDLASLTAPAALAPEPGDRVLDMAAAPGGKTSALAELAGDDAAILAVEPVPHRAAALSSNMRRLGIHGAAVRVSGAESVPGTSCFDRILLDAPCTGEGVLPRDKNRRTGKLVEHATLAALQRRLISHAVRLLAPGGTLVYSTCTFGPEECEEAVLYAASLGLVPEPLPFDSLNGVQLDPALLAAADRTYDEETVAHAKRAFPHKHRTLGFFVARLSKPGDWQPPAGASIPTGPESAQVARIGMGRDDPIEHEGGSSDQQPLVPEPPAPIMAELRDLDPPERELLETMMRSFGDGLLPEIETVWALKVLGRPDVQPRRRIIAVKRERLGQLAPYEPITLGLPIATLARTNARLTLEGGRFIASRATRRVVTVKEKGEQLFLYGRDLLGRSVVHVAGRLEKGDEVIVVAHDTRRYLGIGKAAGADARARPGGPKRRGHGAAARADRDLPAVHHRLDLGMYLRAQQEVPQ